MTESETRLALMGIIIEDSGAVEAVNDLLHRNRDLVIGRMGIPYREKGFNIISIVMDAPMNDINALTGALGRLEGVSAKAVCAATE